MRWAAPGRGADGPGRDGQDAPDFEAPQNWDATAALLRASTGAASAYGLLPASGMGLRLGGYRAAAWGDGWGDGGGEDRPEAGDATSGLDGAGEGVAPPGMSAQSSAGFFDDSAARVPNPQAQHRLAVMQAQMNAEDKAERLRLAARAATAQASGSDAPMFTTPEQAAAVRASVQGGRSLHWRDGAPVASAGSQPVAGAGDDSTPWPASVGKALQFVASVVDGVVDLGVKSTVNGMLARPASGVMALPALALGGTQAYSELQADLQDRLSLEVKNDGGKLLQQGLARIVSPVAETLAQWRTSTERSLGDGTATTLFTLAQAGLESAGFLGAVSLLPGGSSALRSVRAGATEGLAVDGAAPALRTIEAGTMDASAGSGQWHNAPGVSGVGNVGGAAGAETRGVSGLGSPLRGERDRVLTSVEIEHVTEQWKSIGGDPSVLKFNQGPFTGVSDSGSVYIRGDVFPTTSNSLHPTANLSVRETLAHEMGHMEYLDTGVAKGAWNDEFRASYWASKNVPGLTFEERANLANDALQRARDAGVTVKMNSYIRGLLYGF